MKHTQRRDRRKAREGNVCTGKVCVRACVREDKCECVYVCECEHDREWLCECLRV